MSADRFNQVSELCLIWITCCIFKNGAMLSLLRCIVFYCVALNCISMYCIFCIVLIIMYLSCCSLLYHTKLCWKGMHEAPAEGRSEEKTEVRQVVVE